MTGPDPDSRLTTLPNLLGLGRIAATPMDPVSVERQATTRAAGAQT